MHNCLSLLGWWITTLTVPLAEHTVPLYPWASTNRLVCLLPTDTSPQLRVYRLLLSKIIATKAFEIKHASVLVLLELHNLYGFQFPCCLGSQSICLTSHASLSNIQSGACNKLVIAWQCTLHARHWHCCDVKPLLPWRHAVTTTWSTCMYIYGPFIWTHVLDSFVKGVCVWEWQVVLDASLPAGSVLLHSGGKSSVLCIWRYMIIGTRTTLYILTTWSFVHWLHCTYWLHDH